LRPLLLLLLLLLLQSLPALASDKSEPFAFRLSCTRYFVMNSPSWHIASDNIES
jgi:hypothetical protein